MNRVRQPISPFHLPRLALAVLLSAFFVVPAANGQTTLITTDTAVSSAISYTGFTIRDGAKMTIGAGGSIDNAGFTASVGGTGVGQGDGTLEISAGGQLTNTAGWIGYASGVTGQASVSGAGSSWQSSATLTVGWTGSGSLAVTAGATVSGNIVQIARFSTGSATVSGTGSVLRANSTSGVIVGNDAGGSGVLTLTAGGTVTSNNGASQMRLANNATASGTLNIGAAAAAAAAPAGIVNVSTVNTVSGTGIVQLNTTSTAEAPFFLTKDGTSNGSNVTISGLSQVVHTAGYSVFGGVNANSGATTVNGGTLVINGSANNSAHSVHAGGTLGGSGSVGSLSLAEGAFVSPGQSPGTLSVVNGATFAAGSNFVFEISDAAGVAGTAWDSLSVGGTLNLQGTSGTPITIFLTSLDATFAPGAAVNFETLADATFTFASAASITGFDPDAFVVNTSGFANAFDGAWSVVLDENQLSLVYAAVPEPTFALVAGFGALGFACWRRFRRAV